MGYFHKPVTNAFFLFVSLFVVLLLCSGISYSQNIPSSKTYEVSNTGEIKEGNIITAREQAIKNSLDTAVEKAAKEFIPFDSLNMNIEKLKTFITIRMEARAWRMGG